MISATWLSSRSMDPASSASVGFGPAPLSSPSPPLARPRAALSPEPLARLGQPADLVTRVHGQTHGAGAVVDAARDRLADPPRGVRRELEAAPPVELLDGMDQAEVALLDEIQQRKPRRLVLLGDGDDETEVGLDEDAG